MTTRLVRFALVFCFIQFTVSTTWAVSLTWIGGNVNWDDGGDPTLWNPNDEPDPDDVAIFNTANSVNLGTSNSIQGLTLTGNIDLFTNGQDLTVDGLVQAGGGGTTFFIDDSTSLVAADTVAVNAGGTIQVRDGTLTVDEETGTGFLDINAAGTFSGYGTVNLNDSPGAVTSLLINDGTLSAFRQAVIVIQPPPVGTLTINASAANARINLDGGAEAGVVNVFRNQTLEINGTLQDAFTGDLNMFHDTTLDISTAWTLDGGTLDVVNGFQDNPFPTPDVPAGTSTIAGGAFTQTGGTISNFDSDGTLIFDAAFTQSGGSLVNNGLVVFNASTLISSTANMTMPTNTSSITVGSGVVVNVDQANFNVDGNGTATNVIRVNGGGVLDLDVGAGADDTISGSVILSGGEIDVTTADNTWSLGGNVSTVAVSGISQLNGEALSFDGATITVAAGSTLDVNVANTWNAGTTLDVDGLVTLDGATTINVSGDNVLIGDGTLRFGSTSTINQMNTHIDVATFDWDGTTTGQVHTLAVNAQLFIDSANFDSDGDMDDSITMATVADLLVTGPAQWEMRATLTTNGTGLNPNNINSTGQMVLTSATGIFNVNGDTNVGDVTFGPASTTNIAAAATLSSFSAFTEMIYDGGAITGTGTFNPGPIMGLNTVVSSSTISVTNFFFDRGNWVINPGATLTVNVTDYDSDEATDDFDATITLNSGSANVQSASAFFVMENVLNMNNTTGVEPQWTGDGITIGNDIGLNDAQLNVGGSGVSRILTSVGFNSDAHVNIAAGSTLLMSNIVVFDSVNGVNNAQFTGSGTFQLGSGAAFNEATTFNMAGGTVDFDGAAGDDVGAVVSLLAPVIVNAAAFASFGNSNTSGGDNTLSIVSNIGTGSLAVNLGIGDSWTLNPQGVLFLANDNTPQTLLSGSPANLNGTVNITGNVVVGARIHVGGTVNLAAGSTLTLGGVGGANTMVGGTINGPGVLEAGNNVALLGFGTINADIDFPMLITVNLMADDGVLNINGTLIQAGIFGTGDDDGILNVANPWSSADVFSVTLNGGELRGAVITNDNRISGAGLVSARVINNNQINVFGGTLVLETAGNDNDWDGTTNTGQLNAFGGNLEIRDNLPFNFQGSSAIDAGFELFVNGFALDWEPASSLTLEGGARYRTISPSINFGGTLTVGAGAPAEINATNFFFESTSDVTITGTLRLNTAATQIDPGATFSGTGTLLVPTGSTNLRLQDGADVDVLIQNQGTLIIGLNAAAQTTGLDYQQDPSGLWQIDVEGLGLNDFDRLNLTGAAQLAGAIELQVGGGYIPTLGDTLNILSANGGVTGQFNTIEQPFGLPAGVFFNVRYDPTIVQLIVVDTLPGDYNRDGAVNAADYVVWRKTFGQSVAMFSGADGNGDGMIDDDDFAVWRGNFGTTAGPGSGAANEAAVPEPAAFILSLAALLASALHRPRRAQ